MKLPEVNRHSAFTLVELLVVIAIIASLSAISSPLIMRQIAKARATTAINNSKDVYRAMRSYAFAQNGLTPPVEGAGISSSNDVFRTLFHTGHCQSEKSFFVKGFTEDYRAGDEVISGTEALSEGENVLNLYYVAGQRTNFLKNPANQPIMATPNADTLNIYDGTFLKAPFGGQAIVTRVDGSTVIFNIISMGSDDGTSPFGVLGDNLGGPLVAPTSGDNDFTNVISLLPATP